MYIYIWVCELVKGNVFFNYKLVFFRLGKSTMMFEDTEGKP